MENKKLAQPGQYLTFSLRTQPYGVTIGTVREINRVSEITTVPQMPPFVAGVMNLRGKVIPVVSLRLKFGMKETEHTKHTCVIVVEAEGGQVGMIVDSVSGVLDLTSAQIEPCPQMNEDVAGNFVIGMGKVEKDLVVLVDIAKCLSSAALSGTGTGSQSSSSESAA